MTTFAHIETVYALDPLETLDAQTYAKYFTAASMAGDPKASPPIPPWQVAQVPDGTQHGAKPDGHGNYNNPDGSIAVANGTVTPAPAPQPASPTVPKVIGPADMTAWLQAIAKAVNANLPPITGT